ncbi:MAG: DUF4199 domain-containing protein [Bacteroidota bacterium]
MEKSVADNKGDFKRFDIPIKWGIIIGLISCYLTTVQFMYLMQHIYMFILSLLVFSLTNVILFGVVGAQQKKAMGGYISIKDAFQAIFVAILIFLAIATLYGILYDKVIDPSSKDRMKETVLNFMERMNAPREAIDKRAEEMDKIAKESQGVGAMIFGYMRYVIIYSIFGFICAAIVKKEKPANMA